MTSQDAATPPPEPPKDIPEGPSTGSPEHLDVTIRAIARLRAEHHDQGTPLRRAVDRMTAILARPRFLGVIAVVVTGWMVGNLVDVVLGGQPLDPPPFAWLATGTSLVSLFMVMLVLITQRGEDRLAQDREMLILELAILSEKKITKVIRLLEEVRRDNPMIPDRLDAEAETMARPVNPSSVLEAIKGTHVSVPE